MSVFLSCESTHTQTQTTTEIAFPRFEDENGESLIKIDKQTETVYMPFSLFKNIVLYVEATQVEKKTLQKKKQ